MQQSLLQRLLERGRVLSKTNESKIRQAAQALQDVLAAVAKGLPVNEAQRTQFSDAAAVLLEAELSHNQQRQTAQAALRTAQSGTYSYIVDMYDTWLVYEQWNNQAESDQLYKASYVIDEDTGAVTFGQATPVIARMVYEPIASMQERATPPATDTVPLVEHACPLLENAVRSDGSIRVKVIAPGWGSSGFYPAAVLERDGAKAFPKGTHMYWNHATLSETVERPERDLRDLAAVLESDATWQADGPAGPGLYADASVKQGYTAAVENLAPDIGVSINTSGRGAMGEAEGRQGLIVSELLNEVFTSVDFVTKPGAGGEVVQLFEAARPGRAAREADSVPSTPPAPNPQPLPPMQEVYQVNEQEAQALRESNARLETENARLREALLLHEARGVVTAALASIDMPAPTRARLTETLSARPVVADGTLDRAAFETAIQEAATQELSYLAAAMGSGQITGMGSTRPAGDQVDPAAVESTLAEAFRAMGLGEDAATVAARGR